MCVCDGVEDCEVTRAALYEPGVGIGKAGTPNGYALECVYILERVVGD